MRRLSYMQFVGIVGILYYTRWVWVLAFGAIFVEKYIWPFFAATWHWWAIGAVAIFIGLGLLGWYLNRPKPKQKYYPMDYR